MSQIRIPAPSKSQNRNYDPLLCKTCQRLSLDSPQLARSPYSDCEEHFHERVAHLLLGGGLRII